MTLGDTRGLSPDARGQRSKLASEQASAPRSLPTLLATSNREPSGAEGPNMPLGGKRCTGIFPLDMIWRFPLPYR